MTRPLRYVFRMLAFLVLVAACLYLLRDQLINAFFINPVLNSLILGVMAIGILYSLRQALMLWPEVNWVERFRKNRDITESSPRLLGPMSQMISDKQGRLRLTANSMRTILDSIGVRLEEGREISRYMVGLLIFLGLLGTFWGLLETIHAIVKVIESLFVASGGDPAKVFEQFKAGLLDSLSGAGTSFSSSLFGLGGSLILGFLDLQAGMAQNRFYTDLEDWMSGITRLSVLPSNVEGNDAESVSAYLQALLEHTAETMDDMRQTLQRNEQVRDTTSQSLNTLSERLTMLTEQMRTEQGLMAKMAQTMIDLQPALSRSADSNAESRREIIKELQIELRGIANAVAAAQPDLKPVLKRLAEESYASRQDMMRDLRNEFRILTRTLAKLMSENPTGQPDPEDRKRTVKLD
ncbi:MAG: flagellar motor protein MotA [Alphaproteobacteria bacterium]